LYYSLEEDPMDDGVITGKPRGTPSVIGEIKGGLAGSSFVGPVSTGSSL
jgi:hypothetical protein